MSIWEEITRHTTARRLFEVVPESKKDRHVRRLYVSPIIQKELVGPYAMREQEERMQALLAFLQRIPAGAPLVVSLRGRKHKSAALGRMDEPGDEIWEIRDQQSPGLRVTGRFAMKDCFIATDWYPRSRKVPWSEKEAIQDNEAIYRAIKTACKSEWRFLFPNRSPLHGDEIDVYLSYAKAI